METSEKPTMVIAMDDSAHSAYALEWTLDRFFVPFAPNHPFKLVIVHARTILPSIVGHAGPGAADVLPFIEKNIKMSASRVVEKAKEICAERSLNEVTVEVAEGDARHVICEAVEKYNATMLVLGSHGHGRLKRAVLGSVSDYCAQHAHCSALIVKKPKIKYSSILPH